MPRWQGTILRFFDSIYVYLTSSETVIKVPFDDYVLSILEGEIFPQTGYQ
ncbi:MAG: hypothetical protein JOZ51_23635 [Chloroflexi bacterium]|nr:hypothetical protein [Chloroflexota bacterium]